MQSFRERAERAIARRLRAKNSPHAPERTPVSAACPDSREGLSDMRMRWTLGALVVFERATLPKSAPATLYDDVDPHVIRPAEPVRR
jgi:hypothetical protein